MRIVEYGDNGVLGQLGQSYVLAPTSASVSASQLQQALSAQLAQVTTSTQPALDPSSDIFRQTAQSTIRNEALNRGLPTSRKSGMFYYFSSSSILDEVKGAAISSTLNALQSQGYDILTNQALLLVAIQNEADNMFLSWGYQIGTPPTVDPQTLTQLARQAIITALQQANISISAATGKAFVRPDQMSALITSATSILVSLLSQQGIAVI